ncbi:DNA cytosine methyltransferase [Aerococcus urinaehominis]|uniref:Cytosine-specific methyltransferase n=1 Tax=Aerococcus urinaehominis TaxID=128944 RepID=A0A0X8FMA0_9LACT|nr:DNA cytosine methyltransferase [Aerococcus urinaehominis]AMB99900.1 DNA cytosine methyltransferase [Aerococcus urinaehominis]SDM52508.1 DNA (cytosine-5)-methyltransferase 1 [Aerococcus urinaehominis]
MNISAIDLFCGVGGLTHGLERAGIQVIAGIDIESSCKYAYEVNNKSIFIEKDIKEIKGSDLESLYPEDTQIKILVGCAPCQPFSSYTSKYRNSKSLDDKMDLLSEFGRLITEIQPEVVSMENVPQLVKTKIFKDFLEILNRYEYNTDYKIVYGPDYDVPQNRRRLILVASKLSKIKVPDPIRKKEEYLTVRDIISQLPHIEAGETDSNDCLHTTRNLSSINIERIEQSKPGGSWEDWDEELLPNCYRRETGRTFKSVYGRMEWDKPSPTITTQFIGYGNGRFGHPEQNRALSLREGALLQTFPADYKFTKSHVKSLKDIAVQIGNAVPVKLGEIIGEAIISSINNQCTKERG